MALLTLPPSLHIDVVIFENQKLHMQTGYSILSPPRLANPSPKPLVVFGSHIFFFRRVKSVNSHRDGAGRDRHPRNCDRFWPLKSFWRVKRVNSHRDGAGRDRHPRNCDRFWLLISFWRVKSVNSHRDGAGRDRHPRNCDRFWLLITVIVFGFSYLFGVSKMSTVTGMRWAPPKRKKSKK